MKYLHVWSVYLNCWIAVPASYRQLLNDWCVVVTETCGRRWQSHYEYLLMDDSIARIPNSFIVR
jgi:hypothetical protein